MKKFISVVLVLVMVFMLCACGEKPVETSQADPEPAPTQEETKAYVKVGFIYLHDEQSTYDLNFLNAAKEACEELGVPYMNKVGVPEGAECYDAACQLVDEGCNIVFGDSFGHEDYLIQAAAEYPDVQFCHATGTKAHTAGLSNFHNAFASIYEGRYLAGVSAGMKLNEMIEKGLITPEEAVIGYIGAFTYAEVISGYTSFFLGARSICPTATMKVQFTGSWYDETAEKEAAVHLIEEKCVLISQHADSMGAPSACEAAGVPNVSYNGSTIDVAPNTFIVSTRINWAPYFKYIIECVQTGKAIDADWTGGFNTGSVEMTTVNIAVAAQGTVEKLDEIEKKLKSKEIQVFDTSTFTVNGETITSYMADVDSDPAYEGDTEVVKDGVFLESTYRSAPYFDLAIDGIEILG